MFDITQEEDYRELTLEEQYLVNGGDHIENSIEAQAGASVGDTLTREDGTTWTLTQGDINWAREQIGVSGSGGNSGTSSGSPDYGPSGNSGGRPDNSSNNNNPFANSNTPWGADEQMEAARLAKEKSGYELKKTEYKDSGWDFGNSILAKIKDFGKSITYFHFEGRDAKNINLPTYEEACNDPAWRLLSLGMSKYHQNDIGEQEKKFICEDGREAVFTKDFTESGKYELYLDPKYKGTYNYVTISKTPTLPSNFNFSEIGSCIVDSIKFAGTVAGHFFADMVPYYLTGCKNERNQ